MAADQQDDLRATHGPGLYSSHLPLPPPWAGLKPTWTSRLLIAKLIPPARIRNDGVHLSGFADTLAALNSATPKAVQPAGVSAAFWRRPPGS